MAKAQTNGERNKFLDPHTEHNILYMLRQCAIVGRNQLHNDNSGKRYINLSVVVSLMETVLVRFTSEVKGLTDTLVRCHGDEYKILVDKFEARKKSLAKENHEIHKIVLKGVDPIAIGIYLMSAMEQFVTTEIRKCVVTSKTEYICSDCLGNPSPAQMTHDESNNEGRDEEYVPVSNFKTLVDTLVSKFCSDVLKQLVSIKNSKTHETNSTEKDVVSVVNKYNRVDTKDDNIMSTFDAKKNCSIICRFASRNKKYEILSRKQAKEKKCDPLPKSGK